MEKEKRKEFEKLEEMREQICDKIEQRVHKNLQANKNKKLI